MWHISGFTPVAHIGWGRCSVCDAGLSEDGPKTPQNGACSVLQMETAVRLVSGIGLSTPGYLHLSSLSLPGRLSHSMSEYCLHTQTLCVCTSALSLSRSVCHLLLFPLSLCHHLCLWLWRWWWSVIWMLILHTGSGGIRVGFHLPCSAHCHRVNEDAGFQLLTHHTFFFVSLELLSISTLHAELREKDET